MLVNNGDLVISTRSHRVRAHHLVCGGEQDVGCRRADLGSVGQTDRSSGSLLKLAPRAYLHEDVFPAEAKPWTVRRVVRDARILAANHILGSPAGVVFTGESALAALSVPTWWNNPDVYVRRRTATGAPTIFNAVTVRSHTVPPVVTRQVQAVPHYDLLRIETVSGLNLTEPALIILDLARRHHPVQAFYDISGLLGSLSHFDRRSPDVSRTRVDSHKARLLEDLDRFAGARAVAVARRLLRAAPGSFDSPAESVVMLALLALLPPSVPVVSQFPVSYQGRRFYIDLALPAQMVEVEVSGLGKFGSAGEDVQRSAQHFLERQQLLADLGWRRINVTAAQTKHLRLLVGYLGERLTELGVRTRPPNLHLLPPPTNDLFDRRRRF